MNYLKRCAPVLTAAALCMVLRCPMTMQVSAEDNEQYQCGAYTYEYYDTGEHPTVKITACDWDSLSGDTLKIPEKLDGIRVKMLDYRLFEGTEYKKVILPDSLSWVGYACFTNCPNLTEVTVYEADTRNEWVDDPNAPFTLVSNAFEGCSKLEKITFSERTGEINSYVFKDCTSLQSIELPDNLKKIENNLFYGCTSLREITIPDSVTEISYNAFYGCTSLTDVDVPVNVKSIDYGAFAGCTNLGILTVRNRGCIINETLSASYKDAVSNPTILCGKHKSGAEYYAKKHGLTFRYLDDEIPDPSEYLKFELISGKDAYEVTGYEADIMPAMVDIPAVYNGKPVLRIGRSAFLQCKSICSVEISEGIEEISAYAFSGSNVQTVLLPETLKELGYGVFNSCGFLSDINLPEGITYLLTDTFKGCTSLKQLTVPRSVDRIKEGCFQSCSYSLELSILNPYCTLDDSANTVGYCRKIIGAKGSGAEDYALRYNKAFEENGETTLVVFNAQSVGYQFHINAMIQADIPADLLSDPDAVFEMQIDGRTYTKPVSMSMPYIPEDSSTATGFTSNQRRTFTIDMCPADTLKQAEFRFRYGNETVAEAVTKKGTDVTESGLIIKVYDYFKKVLENSNLSNLHRKQAKTAMDFCAATALYFDKNADCTVSDDVQTLDLSVFDSINLRTSGTKPDNLELQFSTVYNADPFMRLYVKFSDDSYGEHTYLKGANRTTNTELAQNSRGEYYMDSISEERSDLNYNYSFQIDSYVIKVPYFYYAKQLAATGDAIKVTLGKAFYLYVKGLWEGE